MKVNKMVTEKTKLETTGATLLSIEEAGKYLSLEDREYLHGWWLRSPGDRPDGADYVEYEGELSENDVHTRGYVRPALKIKNLQSSGMLVGDRFEVGGYEFKIISENLAWMYRQHIYVCWFNTDKNDNDYETSDIKNQVDEWYDRLCFRLCVESL